MLSLAEATKNVRLIAKIIAGAVFLSIFGYLLFIGVNYIINLQRPPAPAEEKFGKLPFIQFPSVPATSSQFEYRINTLDGKLPSLPSKLYVYETISSQATFLALENVRKKVSALGYGSRGTEIERNLFQFTKDSGEILKIHILNNDFEIFSNYIGSNELGNFTDRAPASAESATKSFLDALGISTEEFRDSIQDDFTFFAISNGKPVQVEKLSQANFIRYDLFQNSLNTGYGEGEKQLPIVYPRAGLSTMNFLYAPSLTNIRLVEAHFDYFPVNRESFSDYNIIDVEEAYEKLKTGDAHLARYDPNDAIVDITDVYIGYFLGEVDQGFAIPVIIFEGNNFLSYVDAIKRNTDEASGLSE